MRNRHYVQHLERVFKFWVKKFRFLCTFPFVNIKTNSNDQNKQEQCENRKQYAELDAISCICCTAVVLCCDALRSQQYRNFPWNCLTVFLCCFGRGSESANVFVPLFIFYPPSDKTFIVFSWFDKISVICLPVRVNRRWVCEWVCGWECVCVCVALDTNHQLSKELPR